MDEQRDQEIVPAEADDTPSPGSVVEASAASFRGPLPPPGFMKGYEETLPGSADRILRLAEQEASHRQQVERESLSITASAVKDDAFRSRLGLFLGAFVAIVFVVIALVMVLAGHPWPGAIIGTADIAAVVGVFVYGAQTRRVEREAEDTPGD